MDTIDFKGVSLLNTLCANCTGILVFPQTGVIREITGDEATGYDCGSRPPVKPGTPRGIGSDLDCSAGMFISYQFTDKVESGYITGYSTLNIQMISISDNGCGNWGRYQVYGVKFKSGTTERVVSSSDGRMWAIRDHTLTTLAAGDYVGYANTVLANANIKNICQGGTIIGTPDSGGEDGDGGGDDGGVGTSCVECGGSATAIIEGNGTVCIGVAPLSFNRNDVVPNNFSCTYRPPGDANASVMTYPTTSCGAAVPYTFYLGSCGSIENIGKIFYKAILAGGGERTITPGKTFSECGIGQGIHTYYPILCPNSCATSQGAKKTKGIPVQLWIT